MLYGVGRGGDSYYKVWVVLMLRFKAEVLGRKMGVDNNNNVTPKPLQMLCNSLEGVRWWAKEILSGVDEPEAYVRISEMKYELVEEIRK